MGVRLVDRRYGEIRLQGFSAAGEETVVVVPELDLAFDVGRAPREVIPINHICLSHGHMDHAAGLAYYFSQRNFQGAPPGCVLAPHNLVPAISDLMQVWGRIEGHISPARIVGVDEDEDFQVRRGLIVRPFRVNHPGPSLGFSAIEIRKKLKPEYAEYSGQQIVQLKKEGKTIENRLEVPLVAYSADTAVGSWLDHDHVRNAKVLVIECTFFDDEHLDRASKGFHMHVSELPEVLERVRNEHVVLMHLTRRTGIAQAKRIFAKLIKPADMERVSLLMDTPRRSPRRTTPTAGAE
jgi:ribonuclease Z